MEQTEFEAASRIVIGAYYPTHAIAGMPLGVLIADETLMAVRLITGARRAGTNGFVTSDPGRSRTR